LSAGSGSLSISKLAAGFVPDSGGSNPFAVGLSMTKSRIVLKSGAEFIVQDAAAVDISGQFEKALASGSGAALIRVAIVDERGQAVGVIAFDAKELAAVVVSSAKLQG
jgi:hypothetical protein